MAKKKSSSSDNPEDSSVYLDAIQTFRLPRYSELPAIELYMDQMLGYIEEQVGILFSHDEKMLTASMVNNYVKQKLVPRPQAKKYDRDHLAYLIVVSILKQSFSIPEIAQLIQIQIATTPSADAYDLFCDALEETLHQAFGASEAAPMKSAILADTGLSPARRLMFSTIVSVANRLYVAKMLEFA